MNQLPGSPIERHRAAIRRRTMSRPVRLALESNLLNSHNSFFDYGCGYGEDIAELEKRCQISSGWDPYFRPDSELKPADIVNLGYVINVIESEPERREAMQKAWQLTKGLLIISAQILVGGVQEHYLTYGDGVITQRNTFQKYYQQEELKHYIDTVLGVDSIPADLGVFFVFRDDSQAELYRASRYRSRLSMPRVRITSKRFEDFQDLLSPLMLFVAERGRLPIHDELANGSELKGRLGSVKRAFQLVLQATNQEEWQVISERRRNDLLVFLALRKFSVRPKFTDLPSEVQFDYRHYFGTYKNGCAIADRMLFSLGLPGVIAESCRSSELGKHLPDALYVHVSVLNELDPLLRVYEGCASRTIGRMSDANLIKFHINKPKISYLVYPDFDKSPHPTLEASMQIDLRDLRIRYTDYKDRENPPILHRKETFVSRNYPHYAEFEHLTEQEEQMGLLAEPSGIGTLSGWRARLQSRNVVIYGHTLSVMDE